MEKYYTVMELASLVGVPRTTINDWLGKYSLYISSVQQGKRKVYQESSLAILKEIARYRNEGLSFPEIGEKLAENHPVHPEISSEDQLPFPDAGFSSSSASPASPASPASTSGDVEKVLPLSTHNGEEPVPEGGNGNVDENCRLPVLNPAAIEADFERLGTALALLSEKLALAEEKRTKAFRKGMLAIFIPLFLLILAVGGGGAWYFQKLAASNAKLHRETRNLSGALVKAQEDSRRREALSEKKLSALMEQNKKEQAELKKESAVSLRKAEENHARMMERLTRATLESIEKNRKEFPVILEKELSRRLSEKELFWHKEREKWAKERLLFLKKISEGKNTRPTVKNPGKKTVKKTVKKTPDPPSGKPLSHVRKPIAESVEKPTGKVEKKSPAPVPEKKSGKEDEKKK